MQIIVIDRMARQNHRMPPLNVRQLLNPIFFSPVERHPDSTRQRSARRRTKALAQARKLKSRRCSWVAPLPVVWEPAMYRRRGLCNDW